MPHRQLPRPGRRLKQLSPRNPPRPSLPRRPLPREPGHRADCHSGAHQHELHPLTGLEACLD
ncbi:MAG: hypothetical protein MZV64_23340 [Ignavibacteriales bacterium]|nr:hypothetical protein [Ignavibacteriales bacterium]